MVEFKTPSGYIVKLKRHYLTYGEKVQIQKLYLEKSKVDIASQKISDFDPSVVFEANKMVFNFLVTEIQTPQGEVKKDNLYDFVMEFKDEDGEAIFNELNKYLSPVKDLEKKSN